MLRKTCGVPPPRLKPGASCRNRGDAVDGDLYVHAGVLAERWGVTRATALYYTRRRAFPPPLVLSGAVLRWSLVEVVEWENSRKADPVRRVRSRVRKPAPGVLKPVPVPARSRRGAG